jgi:NTE family protein
MSVDGKTVGLALSGGGFRATLFGLGSLWRLNDAGLLGKLDKIGSVSGGSILSGVLAHRWAQLNFVDGRASNFKDVIADPVRAFCCKTIDVGSTFAGWLNPFKSAGEYLQDHYSDDLFGNTRMRDLATEAQGAPRFVFYATNLQTGRAFRFHQDTIDDYMVGSAPAADVPLALAVAASSAFPPVFSPVTLKSDPAAWTGGTVPNANALRKNIMLADGGIYDNMGLQSLVGHVDIVLVSDAGAPFSIEECPWQNYASQLDRVRDILIDQTRALRKRWLIEDFIAARKQGAYWGIGTAMKDYTVTSKMATDTPTSDALDKVPTRLSACSPTEQGQLINWGYVQADASLRANARLQTPMAMAAQQPVAEGQLG